MMVGSWYYIGTKSDWEYSSVYDYLYSRFERQICASEGFDLKQVEELEKYVARIEH